jgi:hypothetical protein
MSKTNKTPKIINGCFVIFIYFYFFLDQFGDYLGVCVLIAAESCGSNSTPKLICIQTGIKYTIQKISQQQKRNKSYRSENKKHNKEQSLDTIYW